jgi:hypothetical protein
MLFRHQRDFVFVQASPAMATFGSHGTNTVSRECPLIPNHRFDQLTLELKPARGVSFAPDRRLDWLKPENAGTLGRCVHCFE